MPMNPGADETESAFISRCIAHEISKGHAQDQAAAICYSYWSKGEDFKRWDDERKKREERA